MLLRGLRVDLGRDGDRFLLAAGGRVLGWGEDRGAVVRARHRVWSEWAAEFALGGGAGRAVVAVGVGAGDRRELVARELGALLVVFGGLLGARAAREWLGLEQGGGGGGAVEVAVGAGCAHVGAVRAAVVGVQVLDQVGAERADRERPVLGDAVGVAGVGEHVCDRDVVAGHPLKDGHERGWRVDVAAGQQHASGELGDLGAVLVFDGRGGLQVVAVERFVFLAGVAAAAVPPGSLGVGASLIILAVAVAVAVALSPSPSLSGVGGLGSTVGSWSPWLSGFGLGSSRLASRLGGGRDHVS